MVKKFALAAVSVSLVLTLVACGQQTDSGAGTVSPVPSAPAAGTTSTAPGAGAGTVDALAIYKANCISCHGADLEGKLGPNSNLQKVGAKRSKDQIIAKIKNGGGGMPGFQGKLKDAEITALADWLATKK